MKITICCMLTYMIANQMQAQFGRLLSELHHDLHSLGSQKIVPQKYTQEIFEQGITILIKHIKLLNQQAQGLGAAAELKIIQGEFEKQQKLGPSLINFWHDNQHDPARRERIEKLIDVFNKIVQKHIVQKFSERMRTNAALEEYLDNFLPIALPIQKKESV